MDHLISLFIFLEKALKQNNNKISKKSKWKYTKKTTYDTIYLRKEKFL